MNSFKKFLNLFIIIMGIFFIAVCADFVVNRTINTDCGSIDELDNNAICEICNIISLFDEKKGNDDVWDIRYNLRDIGCLITNKNSLAGGRTYAVNVDLSSDLMAQKIEMPDEYSDIPVYRISFFRAFLISKDNNGYAVLGGQNLYCAEYSETSVSFKGAGSLEESYIKNTFKYAVETEDCPNVGAEVSFSMDEENIALMGLQYRIIDDMRDVESKDELNELIAEYVTVRDYQAEMYPDYAVQQQLIELIEGRAQYVFYNISDLIGNDMTYFNNEKSDSITFYSAYHYLCTGGYNDDISEYLNYKGNVYTGSALCEIIDKNKISKNWEIKLDNSTASNFQSQYTLIKSYCSENCKDYCDKTVNDIKREYSYEQIIEMARALVEGNAK